MKKLLSIILIITLTLTLFASCGKTEQALTSTELLDLGEKYLLDLDYEQAIVYFNQVIEVEPRNSRAYMGAAEAYVGLGDVESAVELLKTALEVFADDEEVTIELLETLIKIEPGNAEWYILLTEICGDETVNIEDMNSIVIYYISYNSSVEDYESYVYSMIDYATENGYSGVCVELIAEGGTVTYSSVNTTAIESGAVITNSISNLSDLVSTISDSGLVAYARISTLSDNIASYYDKTIGYTVSGTDVRWYDDNTANGGKPWISPFSTTATEYIESLVSEISDAGFVGLIAGEIEFPPFRNSDLNYFDSSVTSSSRYVTLISFAETVYNSFGSANEFYIEVDAKDIISGDAEILSDTTSLCTDVVYVNFDPSGMSTSITRSDGTEFLLESMNNAYLFRMIFSFVEDELNDTGVTIVPKVTGCDLTADLMFVINTLGYESVCFAG